MIELKRLTEISRSLEARIAADHGLGDTLTPSVITTVIERQAMALRANLGSLNGIREMQLPDGTEDVMLKRIAGNSGVILLLALLILDKGTDGQDIEPLFEELLGQIIQDYDLSPEPVTYTDIKNMVPEEIDSPYPQHQNCKHDIPGHAVEETKDSFSFVKNSDISVGLKSNLSPTGYEVIQSFQITLMQINPGIIILPKNPLDLSEEWVALERSLVGNIPPLIESDIPLKAVICYMTPNEIAINIEWLRPLESIPDATEKIYREDIDR